MSMYFCVYINITYVMLPRLCDAELELCLLHKVLQCIKKSSDIYIRPRYLMLCFMSQDFFINAKTKSFQKAVFGNLCFFQYENILISRCLTSGIKLKINSSGCYFLLACTVSLIIQLEIESKDFSYFGLDVVQFLLRLQFVS